MPRKRIVPIRKRAIAVGLNTSSVNICSVKTPLRNISSNSPRHRPQPISIAPIVGNNRPQPIGPRYGQNSSNPHYGNHTKQQPPHSPHTELSASTSSTSSISTFDTTSLYRKESSHGENAQRNKFNTLNSEGIFSHSLFTNAAYDTNQPQQHNKHNINNWNNYSRDNTPAHTLLQNTLSRLILDNSTKDFSYFSYETNQLYKVFDRLYIPRNIADRFLKLQNVKTEKDLAKLSNQTILETLSDNVMCAKRIIEYLNTSLIRQKVKKKLDETLENSSTL
eukprot:UN30169